MACVGSAVGLGNIWMFPYRLGQYGGGAFLLLYLFFVVLFGWVGLSAEIGLGRMAGTGTIGAYEYCFAARDRKKLGGAIGWIPLMGSLGIAVGYAVILGWVLHSLAGAATDVYEYEPLKRGDRILSIPSIITTPHTGAETSEVYRAVSLSTAKGVMDVLEGREPENWVNRW